MKVFCLIFDGFADWEVAYALPELKNNGVEIITVGFTSSPVESMGGLLILPHTVLSKIDIDQVDLFVIPGGNRWHTEKLADQIADILRQFHTKGKILAAICGATIALARAGLLNKCKHTSNSKEYLQNHSKENYHSDQYVEKLSVFDDNIITASGLGSLEFTLEILKALHIHSEEKCNDWYAFFKGVD